MQSVVTKQAFHIKAICSLISFLAVVSDRFDFSSYEGETMKQRVYALGIPRWIHVLES